MSEPWLIAIVFVVGWIALTLLDRTGLIENLKKGNADPRLLQLEKDLWESTRTQKEQALRIKELESQVSLLLNETSRYIRQVDSLQKKVDRRSSQIEANLRVLGIWPLSQESQDFSNLFEEQALYNYGFEYRSLRDSEANKGSIAQEISRQERHSPSV